MEFGWDGVKECETDKLAEDDDDAKCLEKAEKVAKQKALKSKKVVQLKYGRAGDGEARVMRHPTVSRCQEAQEYKPSNLWVYSNFLGALEEMVNNPMCQGLVLTVQKWATSEPIAPS